MDTSVWSLALRRSDPPAVPEVAVLGEALDQGDDVDLVRGLLERHREYTGSTVAEELLQDWPATAARFVKVMPLDYRRVLDEQRAAAEAAVPLM